MLYSRLDYRCGVSAAVLGAVTEKHGPLLYRPVMPDNTDLEYGRLQEEQGIYPQMLTKILHVGYPHDYGQFVPNTGTDISANPDSHTIYIGEESEERNRDLVDMISKAINFMNLAPIERRIATRQARITEECRQEIRRYEESITSSYECIRINERNLAVTTVKLLELQKEQIEVNIENEIERIYKLKKVRSVSIREDRFLDVVLKPIICDYRNLGSIRVSIDLAKENLDITMNRVTARYHPILEGFCHPHVSMSGQPCWGNLATIVMDMNKNWNLCGIISTCIGFLEVWYPSGAPFVSTMNRWGEPLRFKNPDTYKRNTQIMQEDYHEQFERDGHGEGDYDEDCECNECEREREENL